MLDKNHDGKLTREEAADRPRIHEALEKLGKEEITADEFAEEVGKKMRGVREGAGRPGRPEGGPPPGRGPGGPEGEGPEGRGPGPHGPNFMKVFDTNKDGRLSRDELAKASEKFNELDENNDGELDPRELMGPPPEEMGEEMARGPQGGPRGEFGPRRRGPKEPGSDGDRPRRFGPQGFNGPKGPPEEGPEGRRSPGASGPSPEGGPPQGGPPQDGRRRGPGGPDGPGGRGMEFMQRMFEQLDANDDGKISEEEAPPKMKQRFSMLDANGDGAIDMHELGHARPGGREGKGRGPGGNRPGGPKLDSEKPENEKP